MQAFRPVIASIDTWLGNNYEALGTFQKQLSQIHRKLEQLQSDTFAASKATNQHLEATANLTNALLLEVQNVRNLFLDQAAPIKLLQSIPLSGPAGLIQAAVDEAWQFLLFTFKVKGSSPSTYETTREKYQKGLQQLRDNVVNHEIHTLSNALGSPDQKDINSFVKENQEYLQPSETIRSQLKELVNKLVVFTFLENQLTSAQQISFEISKLCKDEISFSLLIPRLRTLCFSAAEKKFRQDPSSFLKSLSKRDSSQSPSWAQRIVEAEKKFNQLTFTLQAPEQATESKAAQAHLSERYIVANQTDLNWMIKTTQDIEISIKTMRNKTREIIRSAASARDVTIESQKDKDYTPALKYYTFVYSLFTKIEKILDKLASDSKALQQNIIESKRSIDSSRQNEGSTPSQSSEKSEKQAKLLEYKTIIYSSLQSFRGGSNVREKN